MIVYAHGNVSDFCEKNNMIIVGTHDGEIEDYKGFCPVLVTDKEMSEPEYYYLKGRMIARKVELVSVHHTDMKVFVEQMLFNMKMRKGNRGFCRFGFKREGDEIVPHEQNMLVVKRILELRDKGYVLREIREDDLVRKSDGRKLSISTIQIIIRDREIYEKES